MRTFLDKILDDFYGGLPATYSCESTYNPAKYDLVLKKEYIDEKIREVDNAIQYHEEQCRRLREEKEKLLNRQEKKKK